MPEAARAILEDFGRGFSPTQARDSTMRGSVGDRRRKVEILISRSHSLTLIHKLIAFSHVIDLIGAK